MKTFNNLDEVFNFLQKTVVPDLLQNEVAENAKKNLIESYESEIYSYDFDEDYRSRRMSLTDETNYVTEMVDGNTVSVKNVAKPDKSVFDTVITDENPTLLATWIEEGDIPNVFNDRTDYPWTEKREVTKHTVEKMEASKSSLKAVQKGLKRYGIDAKVR